ncbi:MAG: hypothetical protein ABL877_10775 [Thiobacillus sp.]
MPWPTTPVTTTGMDADADNLPRSDILDLATKFNQLIAMRGVADGVCDLDGSGLVPVARIPAAIARLASPSLSGTPTAPTAAAGTNTIQVATTAFVRANDTRGKHDIPLPAGSLRPRDNNGCAPLSATSGATGQPDVPYLAFAATPAQYAGIAIRMPKGWDRGNVTASFQWRRASGTSAANVIWGMRAVAVSNGDSPAAAFGSAAVVTAAAELNADFALSGETGPCTIGGSPAAGDLVFFEFFRDADSTSPADTLTVDAWLTGVTLHYTTEANTDA